jgi:hypothetical protein
LVPWLVEPGGFVLSGRPWSDDDAANYARLGEIKSDYVVVSHLKTQSEPWIAELRVVHIIDGKCLDVLSSSFPSDKPQLGLLQLARKMIHALAHHAQVTLQTPAPLYQVPADERFPYYLLRLEQLLAVRCSSMDGVSPGFLSNEREIIDGNIQLCLASPQNVVTRLLLVQTLSGLKKVRPEIVPEFKDKVALLQKQHPLQEPAQSVVQRMFNDVLAS